MVIDSERISNPDQLNNIDAIPFLLKSKLSKSSTLTQPNLQYAHVS